MGHLIVQSHWIAMRVTQLGAFEKLACLPAQKQAVWSVMHSYVTKMILCPKPAAPSYTYQATM